MTWSYLREHVIRRAAAFCIYITYFGGTLYKRVAVVKLGGDKSMDENLGSLGRKEFSYAGNVTQWYRRLVSSVGERRSAEREVAGSNPGRTNTQGL